MSSKPKPSRLSSAEAAELIGVTPTQVRWLCKHGHLRSTVVERCLSIDREDVEAYAAKRRGTDDPALAHARRMAANYPGATDETVEKIATILRSAGVPSK